MILRKLFLSVHIDCTEEFYLCIVKHKTMNMNVKL